METITITLNGVEVSGNSGITVLELARELGVDIPTLCHDPSLAPYGACRVCLVENEQTGALLASCVTPIAPGMVINTRSPRVLERRAVIVKLMLASHPDSCLVCDKGNRCQLRHIAADLGIGLVDYHRIPQSAAIEELNPFIERDLSKCILCAKCIRADQELVVEGAIDYLHRGFAARPATLGDLPLERSECTFCGTCVALCPTGALSERMKTYRGTVTRRVPTVCPYCGCGCALYLEVKDNCVVRARPNEQGSVNGATLCARGAYGYDFVHSPERLTQPLIKIGGSLQPANWDEALDRVAQELGRIKEANGPDSLAVLGSPKATNEENYLLQKLARAVLGTNNITSGDRLHCATPHPGGSPGLPLTAGPLSEIEEAVAILVVGSDPTASAPVVAYAIKRAAKQKGARLLLVDPRRTGLSWLAAAWLHPEPGTDMALINGLFNIIIGEGLWDGDFVANRTQGFEALKESIQGCTPEYTAGITGVPAEDLRRSARLFATAPRRVILYGRGIARQGADALASLVNLALATGSLGPYMLPGESNSQGAGYMGALPDFLPGYIRVDDARARQRFEQGWGVKLPTTPGLNAPEMILQARAGRMKGMYILGENPALGFPNPALVKEALGSLEFLVVQDLFLTQTAQLASVVLPAASFAEKEGSFTNFQGRVQELHQAIGPVGESRPDWQVICELLSRMGFPKSYASLQQVREEMADLVPISEGPRANPLARFIPVGYQPSPQPCDGYPLRLLVGSSLFHSGSGTRSSRSPRLRQGAPQAYVEINPSDAQALGIAQGEQLRVVSPVGEATAAARIGDTMPLGTVFMPLSSEGPATALFDLTWDTVAKAPKPNTCFVRLERKANG